MIFIIVALVLLRYCISRVYVAIVAAELVLLALVSPRYKFKWDDGISERVREKREQLQVRHLDEASRQQQASIKFTTLCLPFSHKNHVTILSMENYVIFTRQHRRRQRRVLNNFLFVSTSYREFWWHNVKKLPHCMKWKVNFSFSQFSLAHSHRKFITRMSNDSLLMKHHHRIARF